MDRAFCESKIKNIVFRNLTYFMEVPHLENFFRNIRSKKGVNFKFIWERHKVFSKITSAED